MEANCVIVELQRNSTDWTRVVDEIVRIEKRVFPKHESLARSFDDELKKRNAGLLYSHVDGDVSGYVMYSWPTSLSSSITKLAVKENYRGKGVGESLLKEAIKKCRSRKVQRVCLHVDPCRIPAMALYKKCGFQTDHLIESYYSKGRDAYRMYLDFECD
ncbi:putative [ribosomal protein S18]-alanine N-acetyltransferase [Impatiens glandulifera]|uniref:putative [ribosomal protein S18]-alanine N-acetyltransferase n=1 Tax=Impatiens glandulifera TaxID=253017 RepID=UPI001FB050A4|nr:putative [ribosomal protein S18]-alanine N-acetyltransferase [Impatiens glandulifera]XP_047306886.1 putative [ribosomal protein S18]-alanine N-acetyltransferase [Impatiens glandulifera]